MYAPPVNFLLSHAVFNESETRDSEDSQLRRHRLISIRRRLFPFANFYPFLDSVLSPLPYSYSREGYYARLTAHKLPS